MPFSSNDSVDILIRARAQGQAELDSMRGSVEKLSGAERAHIDVMAKLDATMKQLVGGVGTLNKTLEEQSAGVHKATQSIDEWEKRLNAIVSNPAYSVNSPFSMLGRAAQQAALSMGTMGTVAMGAAVGIGVATGAAISLVSEMGNAARELLNFSLRLGLNVDQAQQLQFAARLTGVEISTLEQSARLLGNALADSEGSGKKQVVALRELGVATHDFAGQEREMGAVLMDVLNAMSRLPDVAERAHLAQVLLGRGSKEIIPLIAQFQEAEAESKRFAESLTANANATLIEAKKAMSELGIEWDILKKNLGAQLAPIVITIVRGVSSWVGGWNDETNAPSPADGTKYGFDTVGRRLWGQDKAGREPWQIEMDNTMGAAASANLARLRPTPGSAESLATDLATGNAITKHFNDVQAKTKEGFEAAIKTAKEKQAEFSSIISDPFVSATAKGTAVTGFDQQTANITAAQAGIQGLRDTAEQARHLSDLIKEWIAKRDEANARSLVNPEDRSQLARIADETQNAKANNPQNATLQNLIDVTGSLTFATEYMKEFQANKAEMEKLAKQGFGDMFPPGAPDFTGTGGLFKMLTVPSDRLSLEMRVQQDKLTKQDVNSGLALSGSEAEGRLSGFRSVQDILRSSRNQDWRMDNRFQTSMEKEGGPENEGSSFIASQARLLQEAGDDLKKSLETAGKDIVEQTKATELYKRETLQLQMDTALKVAEIEHKQMEDTRKIAGELFDALDKGRGGFGKFLKSQVEGLEKTLFENAATPILQSAYKSVSSQFTAMDTNPDGKPNIFGKLLQGTPFGIDQAANIKSLDANTAALNRLTGSLGAGGSYNGSGGAGSGFGGGSGDLFNLPGASAFNNPLLSPALGYGNTPSAMSSFFRGMGAGPSAFLGTLAGQPPAGTVGYAPDGTPQDQWGHPITTSSAQLAGQGLSFAGALGGAALGAYSGFSRGTAQGAVTGTASVIAGVTNALSGLSQTLKILGPIGDVASMGLGLVSLFMGNSVQERQLQMQNNVAGSYDRLPDAMQEQFDISGNVSQITGAGKANVVGGVNVNISAFDSKSIVDNWEPIAKALQHAVNQHHPVLDSIRQAR